MKRFTKALKAIALVLVLLLTLTSCSEYDFYEDWHNAGADIEKDNIYKTITLEEASKMKEDGEVFALIYASSSSYLSVTVITSFQAQAEYLGATDKVIYFINSADYNTSSERKSVNEAIGMHEAPSDGSPVIMTFKSGRVDVDTSDKNKTKTKEFIVNGSVQYASLASYIFRELK